MKKELKFTEGEAFYIRKRLSVKKDTNIYLNISLWQWVKQIPLTESVFSPVCTYVKSVKWAWAPQNTCVLERKKKKDQKRSLKEDF